MDNVKFPFRRRGLPCKLNGPFLGRIPENRVETSRISAAVKRNNSLKQCGTTLQRRHLACSGIAPNKTPTRVAMKPRASVAGSAIQYLLIIPLLSGYLILFACASSPQAKEAKYLQRGKELLEKKEYARAVLEFKSASAVAPGDAEPAYETGVAYLGMGRLTNAAQYLLGATQLNPKHTGAQLKLAELMASIAEEDLVKNAASRLEAVLSASPQNFEANDALALVEWKMGKTQEAIDRLQATLRKFPTRLQTTMELVRLRLKGGDLTSAEEALKNAEASAPQSSAARLALGQVYMIANRLGEAEAELRKAIQLDPKNGQAFMSLAAIQVSSQHLAEAEETYRQAAKIPDRQFRPVHALFLYHQGKRDAALAELEELLKHDPEDREARNRLFAAYFAMGKYNSAERLVAGALKKNPRDIDALFERAQISLRSRNTDDAEASLRSVLHLKPDSAEAHVAMAEVERVKGQPLMQRQELNRALELNPAMLQTRLQLARSLTNAKEAKSALSILNSAPAAQKKASAFVVERNWAFLVAGDAKELQPELEQALHAGRTHELVLQDALQRFQQHDYTGSAADAEEIIKKNPDDLRGPRLLADIYLAQKQPAKAEERLREIAAAHPQSAPLANLLGMWYLNSKKLGEARATFEAALAADSKFVPAALAVARLDILDERFDNAKKRLLQLINADPRNVPAQIMLGSLAEKNGDKAEAVRRYRSALAVDSSNLLALDRLAHSLAETEPEEALKYAQQVAVLAPDNVTIQDTLGWVYYKKGLYTTAETYLQNAAAKDPTPQRQYHLAMCYLKSGKRDLAVKTLQLALQRDPNLVASEKGW